MVSVSHLDMLEAIETFDSYAELTVKIIDLDVTGKLPRLVTVNARYLTLLLAISLAAKAAVENGEWVADKLNAVN